jgi:hypothetical protein
MCSTVSQWQSLVFPVGTVVVILWVVFLGFMVVRHVAAERVHAKEAAKVAADIEHVLTVHYRQVLSDPAHQKVWRKLLREAAAARTLAGISR